MTRPGDSVSNSICLDSDDEQLDKTSESLIGAVHERTPAPRAPASGGGRVEREVKQAVTPEERTTQRHRVSSWPDEHVINLTGDYAKTSCESDEEYRPLPTRVPTKASATPPPNIPIRGHSTDKSTTSIIVAPSKNTPNGVATIATSSSKQKLIAKKSAPMKAVGTNTIGFSQPSPLASLSNKSFSRIGEKAFSTDALEQGTIKLTDETRAEHTSTVTTPVEATGSRQPHQMETNSTCGHNDGSIEASTGSGLTTGNLASSEQPKFSGKEAVQPNKAAIQATSSAPSKFRGVKSAPSDILAAAPAFKRLIRPHTKASQEGFNRPKIAPKVVRDESEIANIPSASEEGRDRSLTVTRENTFVSSAGGLSNSSQKPASIRVSEAVGNGDIVGARALVEECFKTHWAMLHDSYTYTLQATMRRQRTSIGREARAKQSELARSSSTASLSDNFNQPTSPFSDMEPIQLSASKGMGQPRIVTITQEAFDGSRGKDGSKTYFTVPTTIYKSMAVKIPPFKEYVSVKRSVLAENEKKLSYYPYLQDEEEESRKLLYSDLPLSHHMKNELQPFHNLHAEQCRFYSSFAEEFLADLGIAMEDILHWLLSPVSDIKAANSSAPGKSVFEPVLIGRTTYCHDNYREQRLWKNIYKALAATTACKLRISAIACSIFLKSCNFSLWHLARGCTFTQDRIFHLTQTPHPRDFSYSSVACRICHEHNCYFHGEFREGPGWDSIHDDSDDEPNAVQVNLLDPGDELRESDVEEAINYKRPANAAALPLYSDQEDEPRTAPKPGARFDVKWWEENSNTASWEVRRPFYPCSHKGSCDQAQCRCFRERINCEKMCACPDSCNRRFPGCSCSSDDQACSTNRCICHRLNRECDADLCGACGATDILDPVNHHKEEVGRGKCCNVSIQRNVPKKTLLGHSEVHGFGLYVGEDVKKSDFLGEYKGEIITKGESKRRANIYEYQKTMYLFNLNKAQEVDATYVGNKMRFINNADTEFSNCSPRVLLCNTVTRIGFFAMSDLKAGTELFFNYGYPDQKKKNFQQPTRKYTPKPVSGGGKVVVVKKKTLPSASSTSSHKTYSSSSVGRKPRSRLSTPERRAQTEKARATLAARKANQGSGLGLRAKKSAAESFVPVKRAINRVKSRDIEADEEASDECNQSLSPSQPVEGHGGDFMEVDQQQDAEDADEYGDTTDRDLRDALNTDDEKRRSDASLPIRRTRKNATHPSLREGTTRKRKRIIAEEDEDE